MIDFDKLKIAHKLAADSEEYYFEGVYGINGDSDYHIFDANHDSHGFFDSEDSLLEKLRELTKPEPGYVGEILNIVTNINGSVSLQSGDYRIIDGDLYSVKKLDKPEELTQPETYEPCKHLWHSGNPGAMRQCMKCGLVESRDPIYDEPEPQSPDKLANIPNAIDWDKLYSRYHSRQHADALVSGLCAPQEPQDRFLRQCTEALVYGQCTWQVGTTGCQHKIESKEGDKFARCLSCNALFKMPLDDNGVPEIVDECQHKRYEKEAPKLSHFTSESGCVFVYKCIKCGEFYR